MRRMGMVIATLAVGLTTSVGRAGVYALDDPPPPRDPALPFVQEDIVKILQPLRAAALPYFPETTSPEEFKKAAAALESSLEAQPEDMRKVDRRSLDRFKLAICDMHLSRYEDAKRVLAGAEQSEYMVQVALKEADLEAKPAGSWTTDDRINLGACYNRLGRYNDAKEVLGLADQNHFLVQANLAYAYAHVTNFNFMDRAITCQQEALAHWPSSWPGWSDEQLRWYRRVEVYDLQLLFSRGKEGGPGAAWKTMDPLFGPPPARGGSAYEAKIQPWKLWGNLPPDAYYIVGQLLVWSPNDDRLYWQLGELLNEGGSLQDAYMVLDEIVKRRNVTSVPEIMEHARILKRSLEFVDAVNKAAPDVVTWQTDVHSLAWAISPRGFAPAPVCGDLANEAAMAAWAPAFTAIADQQREKYRQQLLDQLQKMGQQPPPQPAGPAPQPSPSVAGWPDWRPMLIGFGAGLIVAVLAALQWAEWRRRRPAVAEPAGAPPPPQITPPSRTEPAVHDAGAIRTDASPSQSAPDRMEGAP